MHKSISTTRFRGQASMLNRIKPSCLTNNAGMEVIVAFRDIRFLLAFSPWAHYQEILGRHTQVLVDSKGPSYLTSRRL
jgi:hypothetical protein